MGNTGVSAYVRNGIINTDNNLYLEFSAPLSIGKTYLLGSNMAELFRYRESIVPYLKRPDNIVSREKQNERWEKSLRAAFTVDPVHVMSVAGQSGASEYSLRLAGLTAELPDDPRVCYLKADQDRQRSAEPRLMQQLDLPLRNSDGRVVTVRFCAVISRLSTDFALVDFVDNNVRKIFGQLSVEGEAKDAFITEKVNSIMNGVKEIYWRALDAEKGDGVKLPVASSVVPSIERYVYSRTKK